MIEQPGRPNREPVQVKQFINEFMAENPLPTFWITNHPKRLDPAYLRRFDIVIDVGDPPRSVKRQILANACQGIVLNDQHWLDRQADIEGMTPGLITRLAEVARLTASNTSSRFAETFDLLRNQQLRVQGYRPVVAEKRHDLDHDIDALNASMNPDELARKLAIAGSGRFLFYGPPGTGKSAYVSTMAKRADRPLLSRMASDLLSPYVGETEQKIRNAFELADRENAVLLIDEVDSFLQAREKAMRSWEVTQVNEFLTQLEHQLVNTP